MNTGSLTRAIRRYAGKISTLRNEAQTLRLLDSLPSHLRKDIGWPDRYLGKVPR